MKLIFGKKWKKYILSKTKDVTERDGVGVIGKGTRVMGDKKVNIKEGSIIIDVESKTQFASNGKPIKYKMVFASEEDAYLYLTYKKGGMHQQFYPDREKGYAVEEELVVSKLPVKKKATVKKKSKVPSILKKKEKLKEPNL